MHLFLHLLGYVLGHLALEHIQQLLEHLLGVRVHEVVVHQLLDLPAQAVGEVVQLVQIALGPLAEQSVQGALLLLAFHIIRFGLAVGLVQPTLDALPLGAEDFFHPLLEVVHHRVQVALLELLAALLPQLVH